MRTWLAGLLVRVRIVGSAMDVSRSSQLSLVAAVASASSRVCAVPFAPRITYATDPDAAGRLVGLAGLAGVAATGVVLARERHYRPGEVLERLDRRLVEVSTAPDRCLSHLWRR